MSRKAQLRPPTSDWWRRWPELYRAELEAFARHGASTSVVCERNGHLILEVEWPLADGMVRLRVGYSAAHPYGRPAVAAPDISLSRHQDPINKTLCLLTQDSGEWNPNECVADLIAVQLPKIMSAVSARGDARWDDASELEENAPDPLSTYYSYLADERSVVLFDAAQTLPPGEAGLAEFAVRGRLYGADAFEIILTGVKPAQGTWLNKAFELPHGLGPAEAVVGRWVRLRPPVTDDPDEIIAAANAAIARSTAMKPLAQGKMDQAAAAPFSITALLFDEELTYGPQGQGAGWLFLLTRHRGLTRQTVLVRGHRLSQDLLSRVPAAATLKSKSALLVGAGAIGSFVANELARAGLGTLLVLDGDRVEPGNSVRWLLGREAWGLSKSEALASYLSRNYPYSTIRGACLRVGGATAQLDVVAAMENNPFEWLRDRIREVDVVIDASASVECQQTLALLSRELGKPYVMGHATEGAVGGVVARFRPDVLGCRICLDEHWHDGSLPQPPVDATGTVTPVGCNSPTFTGGAFDLQEVSMELVRSAIGILAPEAYDAGDWTLAVLALTAGGRRTLPSWSSHAVSAHPRCSGCSTL